MYSKPTRRKLVLFFFVVVLNIVLSYNGKPAPLHLLLPHSIGKKKKANGAVPYLSFNIHFIIYLFSSSSHVRCVFVCPTSLRCIFHSLKSQIEACTRLLNLCRGDALFHSSVHPEMEAKTTTSL